MYTVYQAPNTTLDDPPICPNVTFQREDQNLGVETAVTSPAPGNMSQFGWIDQVGSLFYANNSFNAKLKLIRVRAVHRYIGEADEWDPAVYHDCGFDLINRYPQV